MGYELNKLMSRYGVSTPGMVNYSGPMAPTGDAPVAPTAPVLAENATNAQKTQYNKDLAAYNTALDKYKTDKAAFDETARKYNLGQKEYNQYRQDYGTRLGSSAMYSSPQFTGAFTPAAAAKQVSYAGQNTVAAPTYGAVPLSLGSKTQQEKIDYYNRLRNIGYTDADIRGAATKTFGTLSDTDWSALSGIPIPKAAPTTPPPGSQPPPAGQPTCGPGQYYNPYLKMCMPIVNNDGGAGGGGGGSFDDLTRNINQNLVNFTTDEALNSAPVDVSGTFNPLENIYSGLTDYGVNLVERKHGGQFKDLASKYAVGGAVRRFRLGGDEGEEEPVAQSYAVAPPPVMESRNLPPAGAQEVAPVTASPAVQPVAAPPATTTPVSPAATDLLSMIQRYSGESMYGKELESARKRVTAENAAFSDLIAKAMKPDTAPPDKTEMYFRLAAAFGSPSKTGHFTENLALAGKEMADYTKDQRAARKAERQLQLQLGLEAQKLKTQAARDELGTLRTLAGEEMKDKREILKEYIKSGMPQSEAGKAAKDMGLAPGSKEYNDYVKDYVERKLQSGELYKQAMLAVAQGNLALGQARETRTAASAGKLTPAEVKLKSEAEDALGSLDDAMGSLKRAYSLNPNTFDGTLASIAQRKILEQTDPNDPRVLATREQQNLLSKGAIANLRTAFGGNPTEGERKALLDLEGIDAKSKAERAQIMKNTYKLLQQRRAREQKRLNDISAGLYRDTTPSAGDLE